ncbi:MAG: hypothetical protein IT425_09540 [Pirellulales bacterium]|nr:hypothetical protein [Pirellulales bacterium]
MAAAWDKKLTDKLKDRPRSFATLWQTALSQSGASSGSLALINRNRT